MQGQVVACSLAVASPVIDNTTAALFEVVGVVASGSGERGLGDAAASPTIPTPGRDRRPAATPTRASSRRISGAVSGSSSAISARSAPRVRRGRRLHGGGAHGGKEGMGQHRQG
jgi:hypothetical protein